MNQPAEINSNELLARAGLYGFFSGILLREFDEDSLETLRSDEWAEVLAELDVDVSNVEHSMLEELAIDYCGIFVGPKDFCPPYQSVWASGQFQSHVIESMDEFLEIVKPESSAAIKDHAGIQFEMMGMILRYYSEYPDQAPGLSESFFHNHVSWTGKMLNRAAAMATTDLYRGLLRAGARFIQSECDQFSAT